MHRLTLQHTILLIVLLGLSFSAAGANDRRYKEEGWPLFKLLPKHKLGQDRFDLDSELPGHETLAEKFRKGKRVILRLSANGYIYGFLVDRVDGETPPWDFQYLDKDGDGRMEWRYRNRTRVIRIPRWVKDKSPTQTYFLACSYAGDPSCKISPSGKKKKSKDKKKKPEHFSAHLDPQRKSGVERTRTPHPTPALGPDCVPEGLLGAPPKDCIDPQASEQTGQAKAPQWVGEGKCRRDLSKHSQQKGGFTSHDARVCAAYADQVAEKECGPLPTGKDRMRVWNCQDQVRKRVWGPREGG